MIFNVYYTDRPVGEFGCETFILRVEVCDMIADFSKPNKLGNDSPNICMYANTKSQISCTVTAQLISAFVFATRIVQGLFFFIQNFNLLAFFL